jgi:hypothetical protein
VEGDDRVTDFTLQHLNGYAISMGFADERERLEMILNVPRWAEDELWAWMDSDGTKTGLQKILGTKRIVRRRAFNDFND